MYLIGYVLVIHICVVIFTVCNFRVHFIHNESLVVERDGRSFEDHKTGTLSVRPENI